MPPHWLTARVAVGMLLLMLSGCVTSPTYTISPPKPDQMSCNHPMKPSDTLIGIAISGGGSRAALFGASGLEALAKVQVRTYTFSIGRRLNDFQRLWRQHGDVVLCLDETEKERAGSGPVRRTEHGVRDVLCTVQKTMNQDYEDPLFWRNMSRLRFFNPAWTAASL